MTLHDYESRVFGLAFLAMMAVGSLLMALRVGVAAEREYRRAREHAGAWTAWRAAARTAQHFHRYEYELKDVVVPKLNFISTAVHHLYTGYLIATGRRVIPADTAAKVVVRGPDDFLYYLNGFAKNPQDEAALFSAVHSLAQKRGVPMLQVVIPTKQLNEKAVVGNFIDLACDENYAAFLHDTARHGVPRVNCAAIFRGLGVPRESLFYRTDHHWTPYGALNAVHATLTLLRQTSVSGWHPADFSVSDDFVWAESAADMMGVQGLRLGRYWSVLDRERYGAPRHSPNYRLELWRANGAVSAECGDFASVISHCDRSNCRASFFRGSDYPKISLVNDSVPDGAVLVIQDSFGRSFSGYLSLFVQQMIILDPRFYQLEDMLAVAAAHEFDAILYVRSEFTLGMIGTQRDSLQP